MKRLAFLTIAFAFTCAFFGGPSAKTLDPQRWRDEYIAEPARKAMLERYTEPMEKEAYTALRTLTLAKLVTSRCLGSSFDPDIVRDYIAESGLGRLSSNDVALATSLANADFSYFDLTRLKLVCAAAGHLFGDKGVLVPNLVSSGLGLPVWSEPRGEHWITVEPFVLNVDGRTRMLGGQAAPRRPPPHPRQRPIADRRAADLRPAGGAPSLAP